MSWASSRVTTKIEDKAYCLLGILGSRISPQYGEGANAFVRLQQEIFMSSEDYSIFLWSGESLSHSGGVFAVELSMYPKQGPHTKFDPESNGKTFVDCEYQYIRSFRDYQTIGTSLTQHLNWKAPRMTARGIKLDVYVRKLTFWKHIHPNSYMWTYYIYESESEKYLVCIMLKEEKYGPLQNAGHRRSHPRTLFLIPEGDFSSFERSKLYLNNKLEPKSVIAQKIAMAGVAGALAAIYLTTESYERRFTYIDLVQSNIAPLNDAFS